MSSLQIKILMLCPCSGDGPSNPLVLLAMFAGTWILFNWLKALIKSKGVSFMNKAMKIVIIVALVTAVGMVFALKQKNRGSVSEPVAVASSNPATTTESKPQNLENTMTAKLPRLLDLGADKCIPCKMMAPILEELKTTYNGKLQVDFIDVWKNPNEAPKYKISVIPTQIFYDSSGKELFRHEGFFPKKDILAKWKEFGVDLGGLK
ncbi:MAG: thioredoxin family protein [Sedimentisphaerales bacterium]